MTSHAAPPQTAPADASQADPAAHILARIRALTEDLDFEAVKRWKQEHPGALAIGHMPIYAPQPLIEAIGALPVSVYGGGDQLDIIRGDSYFQSYICHIPRSTLELALTGRLDCLDGMLFPSICDVIRNLGGMWKMLFPDSYAAYVDLPQNFDMELGGKFYAQEMRRIAGELTQRGAKPLTDDALWAAIERENMRRSALRELDAMRIAEPWRFTASEAYLLSRAGACLDADTHRELIEEMHAAVAQRNARPFDNVRVVVRGGFCEQPPIGLIKTLEKAGCDVVEDDFQLGLRMIDGAIPTTDADPLMALARAYVERGVATASRYIGDEAKGAALVKTVQDSRADGVIFAAASFCDPALLDQPMAEAALDAAGIPHTSLKYSEDTGQFHVIREQAGAFSDAVKLWGNAS